MFVTQTHCMSQNNKFACHWCGRPKHQSLELTWRQTLSTTVNTNTRGNAAKEEKQMLLGLANVQSAMSASGHLSGKTWAYQSRSVPHPHASGREGFQHGNGEHRGPSLETSNCVELFDTRSSQPSQGTESLDLSNLRVLQSIHKCVLSLGSMVLQFLDCPPCRMEQSCWN